MTLSYNGGSSASPSTIDAAAAKAQLQSFYWLKKSLITARKDQYFMPLSSTIGMPKHFGKKIVILEYVPLLDDRNVNDQGIDAAGVTLDPTTWAAINSSGMILTTGPLAGGYYASQAAALAATGAVSAVRNGGNLYGSSKDIGAINGKMPVLTENGGRVNRVGFTRVQREGTIQKFGLYHEFSKESMDFDSDDELWEHISRELMNGATQASEAFLQKDLLNACGTIVYSGAATSKATVTGEGGTPSVVDYGDLIRLSQILTDNRTPKQTKMSTGSRMQDTRTLPACRVMFVGSELAPLLRGMKDMFDNPAFIAVQHYADQTNVLNGEIGTIDEFRIVQVPEMLHWAGVGASEVSNPGYRASGGNYDVFPMFVVGDESFTTIGFQTDGKTMKFSVITKMPGEETADRVNDPYGEKGFSSLKWWYGVLVKRSERLGLILTVAPV